MNCKSPRLHRFIFILVFSNIGIIFFLHFCFYFNDIHTYVCNASDSNVTRFHTTMHKDDCSGQIDDGGQWQYKNGIHGTWHCWSNPNSVPTSNHTSG